MSKEKHKDKEVINEIKKDKERKKERIAKFGSDDIICFDEITGEVRIFVELHHDTDTGKITVKNIRYL